MRSTNGLSTLFAVVFTLVSLLGGTRASAVAYDVHWLDLSSVTASLPVPGGSVFPLPGYGNVRVSWTSGLFPAVPNPDWVRTANLPGSPSLTYAGDTYAWPGNTFIAGVNGQAGAPVKDYSFTFELLNGPMAAGDLLLGVQGLGRKTDKTTVRVNRTGTFMGDYDLGINYAPTDFLPLPGGFVLSNSVAQPAQGFFNTDFAVVRIDEALSTLTLQVHHIDEDGIGFVVGRYSAVPEPRTLALLTPAAVLLARRNRR